MLSGIAAATLSKDLRLEWRSKDAINSMLFFALLVVVIFSFSFNPTAEESRRIAGGLVWVAFLFAAVVALNQTWARELRNQVLDAYRVRKRALPRQGLRQLYLRERARSADDTAVHRLLQPAGAGAGMAVDSRRCPRNLGTRGEWDIFRCNVLAHAQPRNHAPFAAVPDFDPCTARYGGGDFGDSYRRGFSQVLDRLACGLRCGVYYWLSPPI